MFLRLLITTSLLFGPIAEAQTYRPGRVIGYNSGLRLAAVAAAGPLAPNYISIIGGGPAVQAAVQRTTAGYSGPLLDVRCIATGVTHSVYPQAGGDYPDNAAEAALCSGSAYTVSTLYGQTGSGINFSQPTNTYQPRWNPAIVAQGQPVPITFSKTQNSTAPFQYLEATGLSLDLVSTSFMMAWHPANAQDNRAVLSMTASDGTTYVEDAFSSGLKAQFVASGAAFSNSGTGTALTSGKPGPAPMSLPGVLGLSQSALTTAVYANGGVNSVTRVAGKIELRQRS